MAFEIGSEWRKWDLHIHTPASNILKDDYKGPKKVPAEDFIKELKNQNISVVAITDHHIIDIDYIEKLRNAARAENYYITILPGIEIRTELEAKENIHLIAIFSDQSNIEYINNEILAKLDISSQRNKETSEDKIYCNYEKTVSLVHELGGKRGLPNFQSLIDAKKEEHRANLDTLEKKLKYSIKEFLDNKLILNNIDIYKNLLIDKEKQINDLNKQIEEMSEKIPFGSSSSIEKNSVQKNINILTNRQDKIDSIIEKIKVDSTAVNNKYKGLKQAVIDLNNLKIYFVTEIERISQCIEECGVVKNEIDLSNSKNLNICENGVHELMSQSKNELDSLVDKFNRLKSILEKIHNRKEIEINKLSGIEKQYQSIQKDILEKSKQVEKLTGNDNGDDFETLNYYKKITSDSHIKSIELKCKEGYEKLKDISFNIFDIIKEEEEYYSKLKNEVQNHLKEAIELSDINVEFKTNISILNKNEIENKLLSFIAKKNDFLGEKREETIKNIFYSSDAINENFLEQIYNSFLSNEKISYLLKEGQDDEAELYFYILSLSYLKVGYSLELNGKNLDILSPGEKGLLLLSFFLLADKSDVPLLLDQPEENLDNQTIFKTLVPLIKYAKKRRQVIMVTHNPNLAVVCDSEQIIHAEMNVDRSPKIKYYSGSIENKDINKKIVDILEGTKLAFENRKDKYD